MALYEFNKEGLTEVKMDSMTNLRIRERQDLQDVLRNNIEAVAPDVLVISEEYTGWQDSKRRIDLLGIDRDGNLVVFELKRTNDGGHMDLQAIRYAAMVSALTFDEIVDLYGQFLKKQERQGNAKDLILEYVSGGEVAPEASLGEAVRIVLVSQDFDSEITTTVLWLNEQGLDIRCVRLHPYQIGTQVVFDIQQVLPLPEATDYMVKKRQKEAGQKAAIKRESRDFTKYRVTVDGVATGQLVKRRAILAVVQAIHGVGISPEAMRQTINQSRQRFYEVEGVYANEADFVEAAQHAADQNGGKRFDEARYFTADDELFHFEGKTYAFSNQWGTHTEAKMSDLIAAHAKGRISIEREET